MIREINDVERTWLDKILSAEFKGKDVLKEQLSKTRVSVEENVGFILVKFHLTERVQKYPFNVIAPVYMIALQKNAVPIIFALFIVNGYIYEMEIFNADSSEISVTSIDVTDIEYDINADVRF